MPTRQRIHRRPRRLQQPGKNQDCRGENSDLGVCGRDANHQAAHTHADDGCAESGLAAELVRQHADNQAAHGSREESHREDRHRTQQRDQTVVGLGEELRRKVHHKHRVDVPVKPLQSVANQCSEKLPEMELLRGRPCAGGVGGELVGSIDSSECAVATIAPISVGSTITAEVDPGMCDSTSLRRGSRLIHVHGANRAPDIS